MNGGSFDSIQFRITINQSIINRFIWNPINSNSSFFSYFRKRSLKKKSQESNSASASATATKSLAGMNSNSNSNITINHDCLVSHIMIKLSHIAKTKTRSIAAIQAIPLASMSSHHDVTGTVTAIGTAIGTGNTTTTGNTKNNNNNSADADADANIIIMAVILLHKFIKQYSNCKKNSHDAATTAAAAANDDDDDDNDNDNDDSTTRDSNADKTQQQQQQQHSSITSIAIVQAHMAQLLSQILMVDKTLLERTINNHHHVHSSNHGDSNSISNTTTTTDAKAKVISSKASLPRDAKTILAKSILAVIASALVSYQTIAASTTNTNSNSNSNSNNDTNNNNNTNGMKQTIQAQLSTLETMLSVPKRKASPSTSSVLHIPVTSQHAHSIPMNSQGEYAWSSLCKLLFEDDLDLGAGLGLEVSSSGGDGMDGNADADGNGGDGARNSHGGGNRLRRECHAVSAWLDTLEETVVSSTSTAGSGSGSENTTSVAVTAAAVWTKSKKGKKKKGTKAAAAASKEDGDANASGNVSVGGNGNGTGNGNSTGNGITGVKWMKAIVGLEEDGMGSSVSASCKEDGVAVEVEVEVPPVKRKRRSKGGNASANVGVNANANVSVSAAGSASSNDDGAEEAIQQELLDGNVIEGRVTVKKLASMAFVHCCAGQYHLLNGLIHLLGCVEGGDSVERGMGVDSGAASVSAASGTGTGKNEHEDAGMERISWKDVMAPDVMEWAPLATAALSPSVKRGKKKSEKNSKTMEIRVMPSLALSALSVRIVEIVQESGKLCGTFPTKNGMEDYLQGLYDAFDGVVLARSTGVDVMHSVQLGSRARRPSIYNLVIAVLRLMILNHGECLKDIAVLAEQFGQGQGPESGEFPFDLVVGQGADDDTGGVENGPVVGHILVNEEELVKEAIIKEYTYYNPVMHKTIEILIRCVNTSFSSTERNDCKILYGFAAAFALKASVVEHHCGIPKRKKKGVSSSTSSLVPIVDSIVVVDAKLCSFAVHYLTDILANIVTFTKNSFRGDVVDKGASMNAEMIGHFYLDNPIVPDQTLNQAGIFIDETRDNYQRIETADEKGWRNGFLLALFFRALLPTHKKASKSTLVKTPVTVIDAMMIAIKTCYAVKRDPVAIAAGKVKKK